MRITPYRRAKADAMLVMLIRCADAAEHCPDNAAITQHMNMTSGSEVSPLLVILATDGAIRVEHKGGQRRVTIIATGHATDWTKRDAARKRVSGAQDMREARGMLDFRGDLPPERYAYRDPCGYCGVNPAIGCRHVQRMAA